MKPKRGRKSANALTMPKPLETVLRQPLPPELRGDEAEAFLAIVNAEPADWFTIAAVPLLVQYARHIVQARRVAELIEGAVGNPGTDIGYYTELLKQQRAESAAIASLATKLRLSPQSIRNNRGNPHPARHAPAPWEA